MGYIRKKIKIDNFITHEMTQIVHSASDDRTRYHLNGVYLDFKNNVMVATNGHIMSTIDFVVPDELKDQPGVILPPEMLKDMFKVKKPVDYNLKFKTIEFDMRNVTVGGIEQTKSYQLIEGEYPDYRQIIPSKKPTFSFGINADYILKIVNSICHDKKKKIIRFDFTDQRSPAVITTESEYKVKGIIMPCRLKKRGK